MRGLIDRGNFDRRVRSWRMAEPRVPGSRETSFELPCGETIDVRDLDMGMREVACSCGERHAVVTDVHPPGRFIPESLVSILRETVDTAGGEPLGTVHLMGMVVEEFPEQVSSKDVSENGSIGYSMVWVSTFDSRQLHEVVVELIVELMEHAVSHAEDGEARSSFEQQMLEFDISEFVTQYRNERDFDGPADRAV
jgi:hypothetical protein